MADAEIIAMTVKVMPGMPVLPISHIIGYVGFFQRLLSAFSRMFSTNQKKPISIKNHLVA